MNTLFTFGCSFTEDFEKVPKYYWGGTKGEISTRWKYIENYLKGEVPKSWPKLLSEKLHYNIENYGEGGKSNMRIFENFISKCDDIKHNDIVIINWTSLSRFKWLYNKNFITILPNSTFSHNEINESTLEDILINKSDRLWNHEIYNFIKIINKLSDLVGFEIYYWSHDNLIINSESSDFRNDKRYLLANNTKDNSNTFSLLEYFYDNGIRTINHETNGVIVDHHYGKRGNEIIADLFYKHIKK